MTGGTGDVSPQQLLARVTMTAANTYTELPLSIPIARFQLRKGKSIIMEVLKVRYNASSWDSNPAAGGNTGQLNAQVSTISLTASAPNDPHVFSLYNKEFRGAFTAAGSYEVMEQEPFIDDISDGAGHGYLVATDNVFLGLNTANFTNAAVCDFRITYRFKEVDLEEYIGIVQGQQ